MVGLLNICGQNQPPKKSHFRATADGRNPAPVDMVNILLFTWFYTSQVVQDFFHQQYHRPIFFEDLCQVEMHQTFILWDANDLWLSFHFHFQVKICSPRRLIKHIYDQNDGCSVPVNGNTHAWWNVYYLTTCMTFLLRCMNICG